MLAAPLAEVGLCRQRRPGITHPARETGRFFMLTTRVINNDNRRDDLNMTRIDNSPNKSWLHGGLMVDEVMGGMVIRISWKADRERT